MAATLDVSNYTSPLTTAALVASDLVIVQALDPPAGYPASETRAQLQACQVAGVPTDIYYFLFAGQSDSTILHHLSLADGFRVRKKWLDIEEPGLSVKYIAHVLALLDGYASVFPTSGIYGAAWWNATYPGILDHFSASRDLWAAQYDGNADASVFTPFAGWSTCRIKQYAGTSTFGGVTGVDLNALSAVEAADLLPIGGPVAIKVGQGIQNQMAASGDAPLADHLNYTQTDDDGIVFKIEKCLGSKGLYVSSNASGNWVNAGPM